MASPAASPAEAGFLLAVVPDLAESARVRSSLRETAERLGFPEERIFDIQVAVGEALANAIEHAHGAGEIEVRAAVLYDGLEVTVRGAGDFHVPRGNEKREHRGLGLPLMATLSDHLAFYSVPDGGTLVALTFYLPGTSGRSSALLPTLRRLEEALREGGPFLGNLAEGLSILDRDWHYVFINEAGARQAGKSREEMLGRSLWEVLPRLGGSDISESFCRAASASVPTTWVSHYEDMDSYFEYRTFPFDGGIAVFSRDITGERRAVQALRQSEARARDEAERAELERRRLEAVLQALPVGVGIADTEGRILLFNEALSRLWGGPPVPQGVDDYREWRGWWPDLGERLAAEDWAMARALRSGEMVLGDVVEIEKFDGSGRATILNAAAPIKDAEGQVVGGVVAEVDITPQRRAEEALRVSEERYRTLFENMSEGFAVGEVIFDEEGGPRDFRFLDANEAFHRQSGLPREAVGPPITEVLPQLEREWIETYTEVALTGRSTRFTRHNRDTERFYDVFCYQPGYGRFAIVFRDVTNERRSEEALRESEERYRTLAELNPDAVLVNHKGRFVYANQAAARVLGARAPEDLLGLTPYDLIEREHHVMVRRRIGTVIDEGRPVPVTEYRWRRLDGCPLDAEVTAAPVPWKGEAAAQVVVRDIGDRRRAAEEREALARENARLYDEQKRISDSLQQALLRPPKRLPDLEASYLYRSATEAALVGGDFFDLFEVDDNCVGLVIGDVCGHGVEAATLASLVRDTLRAYALQGLSLEKVMSLTNEAIGRQTDQEGYTTVLFALLDRLSGDLQVCSAGHPAALVRRRGGRVEALTSPPGAPLGVFAGESYAAQRTRLERDEVLLLYTDGVVEARQGGAFFGKDRLGALLESHGEGAPGVTEAIFTAVNEFTGGSFRDDLALLAVERKVPGTAATAAAT
jgi:PAS domain S-box-containing protein